VTTENSIQEARNEDSSDELHINVSESDMAVTYEHNAITQQLQQDVAYIRGAKGALAARKQSVLEELKSLMEIVEKANSIEEVDAIARNISSVRPAVKVAAKSSAASSMLPIIARVPHNKKERQQPRLQP